MAGARSVERPACAVPGRAAAAAACALLAVACPRAQLPEAETRALQARVETARGLGFRGPLALALVSADEASRAIGRELDYAYAGGALERDAETAALVGMLSPGTDLRAAMVRFTREAVLGFYAPVHQRLFVIDQGWRERRRELESVVVHELTHALQDQRSPLIEVSLGLRGYEDVAFALGAYLEGEALWTEYRDAERSYGAPPPSLAELRRGFSTRMAEAEFPDVPRALREPFVLQYPLGYALVAELAGERGSAALDAAVRAPPLSSEQLLHPEKYRDPAERDLPRFVSLPADGVAPPGCGEVHRQTWGELGLGVWLRERLGGEAPGIAAAAAGWDGDRVVGFRCPDGGAFAWLVLLDTPGDAEELARAAGPALAGLRAQAALRGEPRLERRGSRVLVSAGLAPAGRERVWSDSRERELPDLEAFLAEHPEVRARARALRLAAR